MRFHHIAVPLALLFWQAAPAPVPTSRPSPLGPGRSGLARIGLAFASGEWEDASFDCSGNWTGSTMVPTRSAGVKVDYLTAAPTVRLNGQSTAGGAFRLTVVGGRWWMDHPYGYSSGYPVSTLSATFVGAQVAYEGRGGGLGFGVLRRPVSDGNGAAALSVYLRLGSLDSGHFQAEVYPPTETPGMMGTVRVGVGFGQGFARRPNGFVGVAFGPYVEKLGQGVLLGDIGIPLASGLDLLVRGSAGPGAGQAQYAVGGGLRAVF